jgi:cell wall assembly regulator SMI1
MKELWKRLEAYLKKHAPAALDFLNPPATKDEIKKAETQLRVQLPADLAESLIIHNGQLQETGRSPHPICFIPQEYDEKGVYKATFGELAPLSHIVETTLEARELIRDSLAADAKSFEYDGPIRRDGKWSWVVFVDAGSGDTLALDLNPDKRGDIGQVLSIIHDPGSLLVLAPSYRKWFQTLVERFESGRYIFEKVDGEIEALDTFSPDNTSNDDGPEDVEDDDDDDRTILRFPR